MSPQPQAASPWHRGEVAIQESVGLAARLAELGPRVIRDHLTEQHQNFYPLLPFLVLGTVDRAGRPWATLRAGKPGFLHAPDPRHLRIEAEPAPDDPAEDGLEDGAGVGLLGIELGTRRRNRLNGTLRRDGPAGVTVAVEQSFGNCPQYIRPRRETQMAEARPEAPAPVPSDRLDGRARALVEGADTFFVASFVEDGDGSRQVDASHRGGPPGFVRVGTDGSLTIPDYSGNRFFNTLGNLLVNPRAGLVFPDFSGGDLLQMTGGTEVLLDPAATGGIEGAERLWRFTPERVVFRAGALPLRFQPAAA